MEMLELVRQQIQMNRWKNQVGTQVTLDDDFIIPDTMSDADQMILSAGDPAGTVKNSGRKSPGAGKAGFSRLIPERRGRNADARRFDSI